MYMIRRGRDVCVCVCVCVCVFCMRICFVVCVCALAVYSKAEAWRISKSEFTLEDSSGD